MVSSAFLIVVALLLFSVQSPPNPPNFPNQYFCSAFCKPNKCSGFGPSDCTDCNTGTTWGWTLSGGVCSVTVAPIQYLDSSDDAGGMISLVAPTGRTSTCTNLTGYLGYTPYGDFKANDQVEILLSGGTTIPHYQVNLIFDVILIDIDSGGSTQWKNSPKMTATLAGTPPIPKDFRLDSPNPTNQYKAYCKETDKKDRYYQFQQTFFHNDTSNDIAFSITTDNNDVNALWNAKEFIMTIHTCHIACLSCNASSNINSCFSCDPSIGYMLNNYSCLTSCVSTSGFGYTEDPAVCVFCNLRCTSCFGVFDNCTACKTSGTWRSYLYYNDTLGYWTCVNPCPALPGHYVNASINTCQLCDPVCATCLNQTYCFSCVATYGWTGHFCYNPCPSSPAYFMNGNNCTRCNLTCITCIDLYTCTECTLNGTYMAFLYGTSCLATCPPGSYGETNYGLGPNICMGCSGACATCTGNPSPCQSCNTGWFLYNSTCGSTCPSGYIAFSALNQCLDCSVYCVDVTINPYFADSLCEVLYVDMTFTKDLNFGVFDMTTFQTVSIDGTSPSEYTVNYQQLTNSSYRIIIEPKGYIFLYNKTVTITTKTQPAVLDTANDTTPFKPTSYSKSGTISWFLLRSPSMTEGEKNVINNIASINTVMAKATTAPFVAEVKKSGLFTMLFSGAQITSATVFVNSIPSQNMYEAVRFWAIPVLYDVPAWQQNSKIPNNVFGQETSRLVKDQRLLFDMTTTYWRYQRTGHSSFFIYDIYIPMLLISICWILALVAYCMRKSDKNAFKTMQGKFFTVLHKLHEAVILYVTTAMMLEWMYFDAASEYRWLSLLICLVFTAYFVGYELYIYYDMIKYPEAFIGNAKYEYYLNRYGSFLKNLRYEQYDMNEEWSPKHWFRPYNYHILSYYKKFCMIMSLPLFYQLDHCQPAVLLILQCLEIARFLMTKPYYALWRNVFRFLLELILLFFFLCIMINTYIIDKIIVNDPNTLDYYVRVYYAVGWAGFAMVFAFNIGHLILFFIDIVRGFKYSNRQLMEQARRLYYYDKISVYQRDNEQVPLGLMNRWVKLGNLNKRKIQQLPDINVRIEYFKLIKHNEYFDVDVFKVVELFMNTDLNYHRENNTLIGRKIKKKIKLSRETSKSIYSVISDIFSKYAKKDTEAIVVKTFVRVLQSKFQAGDRIPLLPHEMFQKIELQNYSGEKENIKLKDKMKGFPLNPHDLESIG